ncbi:MAG: N-acetyltransferase [Pseudomonadota bacterium]|nr:N-acetyltransferase [Pseudomonadota bacterium]
MSFILRAARIGDVPRIHELILALAEFEQLRHLVVASDTDLARALFGPHARVEALVAELDHEQAQAGQIVAFGLYYHNYSTFLGRQGLYLEDLFVDPDWRRRGIARTMLQRLAALALERSCGRFDWAVLDWNQNAIRFYERLGATVLPDWRLVRVAGAALHALAQVPGSAQPDV